MSRVDEATLAQALKTLSNWKVSGASVIERDAKFQTYRQAIAALNRIADSAEGANHHPDLSLSYTRMKIQLTTHDAGGLTKKDLHLAAIIEDILQESGV